MERNRKALRRRFHLKLKNRRQLPRVSLFKSNRSTYIQVFDDLRAITLLSDNDRNCEGSRKDKALSLGERAAKKFLALGFKEAIYDFGWRKYHGIVKICLENFQLQLK